MKTERFKIGPFAFTFRGGRVWWRYAVKMHGTRIVASGATSISTVDKLAGFLSSACSTYGADGLLTFVRWHMGDIPGAVYWAEHYTRVQNMGRKLDWRAAA